jgi:N-acetylneuraminic acid mutarotase
MRRFLSQAVDRLHRTRIDSEMIVWGGVDETFNDTNTGGRYNPNTDSWTTTSLADAPSARDSHTAVWTGSRMIVWSGYMGSPCDNGHWNTGARYEPITDSWTPTSTTDASTGRANHTALWTGSEMIVWGGYDYIHTILFNTGGRYCGQTGATPTPTPTATATATPTATPNATPTPTATPRATPTPRLNLTPRSRPTPRPRP